MTVARTSTGLVSLGLLAAVVGCESPGTFIPLPAISGPAGVLDGTVTYSGPPPCTKAGRIVGAAIVLAFDERLLPPPEGLGSSAPSLDVIPGDELFAGIRAQLPTAEDGSLRCPEAGTTPVTVSGTWHLGPLPSGTYQVRGFYDLDGDFNPSFTIANLPTRGDVAGGAIDNAGEVLAGAAPRYRAITLGVPDASGVLAIPDTGARVGGIAVTLGLPLPLERPVFHVAGALGADNAPLAVTEIEMPSDFQFDVFSTANPTGTEQSFIRLELGAGVPAAEVTAAAASPFFFPVEGSPRLTLLYSRQDVNGDGLIDGEDHIPESPLIPALFPVAAFSKLADGSALVSQAAPAVILQGLTLYQSLLETVGFGADQVRRDTKAIIALRPSTLCVDPARPERGGVLVISRPEDKSGNRLLREEDEAAFEKALSEQFGRTITVEYGCLPQGTYAMSLVYGTGQAWTVPNEAGVCAPAEPRVGGKCGGRAFLASQSAVLKVGEPGDAAYCEEHPTPALCLP
jgi:hypothetical protein